MGPKPKSKNGKVIAGVRRAQSMGIPRHRSEYTEAYMRGTMQPACLDCGNYLLPCTTSANGVHRLVGTRKEMEL